MATRHISIKISGTPVRKGGFIPIVNINDAFFEISDSYPASLSRDACLYSVRVMPDATVYKLVFNRMRHSNGDVAGLVIGFSIPAGYRLPDGSDAAGVLHSLLEVFVGSFAMALPDGSFEYRFGRFDTTLIENICMSVDLVPCDDHRTVMKEGDPRGAMEVPGDRIAKTLDDMGSTGMDGISELLVGEHINMPLAGIAVPLQKKNVPATSPACTDETFGNDLSGVYTDTADENRSDADTSYTTSDDGVPVSALMPEDAVNRTTCQPAGNPPQDNFASPDTPAYCPRPRRMWQALFAGIFLGALAVLAIVGMLRKDTEPIAPAVISADTSVIFAADTLASTPSETVYVEKKIIVEVAPKKNKYKPGRRVSAPKTSASSTVSSTTSNETTGTQETNQEPQLKYDPEAERSL